MKNTDTYNDRIKSVDSFRLTQMTDLLFNKCKKNTMKNTTPLMFIKCVY